jgi:hypothetical protein
MLSGADSEAPEGGDRTHSCVDATFSASEATMSVAESDLDAPLVGRIIARRKRGNGGKGRMWATGDTDSDASESVQKAVSPVMSAPKVPRVRGGRGGYHHSVGLSQARKELADGPADGLDDSGASTLTEVEPAGKSKRRVDSRTSGGTGSVSPPLLPMDMTIDELEAKAEFGARKIEQVLLKSKNLKGTCVKEVREAALSVMKVVRALVARGDSDELRRLSADNKRLRGQMSALTEEVAALRRAFSEREVPAKKRPAPVVKTSPARAEQVTAGLSKEEFAEAMGAMQKQLMLHIGGVISARLEGLEVDGRLLPAQSHRPPLRGDRAVAAARPKAPTTLAPPANMPRQAGQKKTAGKKAPKGGDSRSKEQVAGPSREVQPLVVEEGWTTVASKPRKAPNKVVAPAVKAVPRVPKPPKTLAVVVALKPEALAQGATYAAALAQAKQKVSLSELGIGPGKFRRSLTGACIMELPKETTASQADALAAKMGEALGEAAVVSRPVKMADIRVSGVDDSVSVEELRGALAEKAGCPPEKMRVGAITTGVRGMGAAFVSCPVEAAAKLVEGGRVVVGWCSATIQALEQRPMHCHRCMQKGHTKILCPSKKDRSGLCYRCGTEGHLAASCSAPYKCAVCADRGLPTAHKMTGPQCTAPPVKGRAAPLAANRSAPAAIAADATRKVTPMDTNA